MSFARTIVAFILAFSVGMLPVTGTAVAGAKLSQQGTFVKVHFHSDGMAEMDDCCPDQAKPCDQNGAQCQLMVSCALQSISVAGAEISYIDYPTLLENLFPALADKAGPSYAGNPLFRPPRI
jgi:hypothetical protein